MEGAIAARWVTEINPGVILDGGAAPNLGKPMSKELGMERLTPLLMRAAKDLNTRHPVKKLVDRLEPKTYRAVHDPGRHPKAGGQVQDILYATEQIHQATKSGAWKPEDAATLNQALAELAARLDGPGKRSGTQQLEQIASTLTHFMGELEADRGHALHAPWTANEPLTASEFAELKASPNAILQDVIADIDRDLARLGSEFRLEPQAWPRALEASKATFRERLGGLKDTVSRNQLPEPEAIQDTVMALVAPLVGLDLTAMSRRTFPEIAISKGLPGTFPHVPGMNLAPGQKRKASFDPLAWQLNIPGELLMDPQRLESRLAGLALDIAMGMSSLMLTGQVPEQAGDGPPSDAKMGERLIQIHGSRQTGTLDEIQHLLLRLKPHADHHIATDHGSAAAVLRTIASLGEVHTDRVWHEGWRAEVKAAGEHDPAAREAYQARTWQRWAEPLVALRRALQGSALPQDEPGMPWEDDEEDTRNTPRAGPA